MTSLWEQMVVEENRLLAARLGLRISDVEEQLLLLGTLEESKQGSEVVLNVEAVPGSVSTSDSVAHSEETKLNNIDADEEEESYELTLETIQVGKTSETLPYLTRNTLPEGSGPWPLLPQVLVDYILFFVGEVDTCGYLCIASQTTFAPSEAVYKFLCELTYLRQTNKKVCHVEHWKSWRNMIINRPRLRLNGFYSLRTMYSKSYCNDAFWEEKKFESIEVKYYRHLRFFENGRVLYSLDTIDPWDVTKLLRPGVCIPKRVYEGRYFLVKNQLRVEISLHYCDMIFEMLLSDGNDGFVGKHNMLTLLSHSSIPFNTGGTNGAVAHHIPLFPYFRFHRASNFYPHTSK